MRALRGAPLRCCMYCLASGVPRTEEHLIPRALGGRLTLRDAVCEPCRRFTGRLEQLVLERDFVVPRTLLALKRRRARGQGPGCLPPTRLVGADAPSTFTAATFPRGFSLPVFEPAGRLSGIDRPDVPARIAFVDCRLALGTPMRLETAAAAPPSDPRAHAYALAKWAYALAVARRGLDSGELQDMRDLLLGRRHDVFAFVGTPAPSTPAPRDHLHDFAIRERAPWLTVTLALFASAGMAPHEIVVGRAPAPA
jgi:hypothetical protein